MTSTPERQCHGRPCSLTPTSCSFCKRPSKPARGTPPRATFGCGTCEPLEGEAASRHDGKGPQVADGGDWERDDCARGVHAVRGLGRTRFFTTGRHWIHLLTVQGCGRSMCRAAMRCPQLCKPRMASGWGTRTCFNVVAKYSVSCRWKRERGRRRAQGYWALRQGLRLSHASLDATGVVRAPMPHGRVCERTRGAGPRGAAHAPRWDTVRLLGVVRRSNGT